MHSNAAASQLSASVLQNCVVKFSLSELLQLNNPKTVIEPEAPEDSKLEEQYTPAKGWEKVVCAKAE